MSLEQLIKNKEAKVAVIGLGYVGLPSAVAIAKSGYQVFGVDIKKGRVDMVNDGQSYINDVPSEDVRQMVDSKKLQAFNSHDILAKADIVLICVPTPLNKNKVPNVSYIISTTQSIVEHLRRDQLIVLESSTYPGTTREVVLPILEKTGLQEGKDFFLAYSPERVDPGNKNYSLENIPRVVGGISEQATQLAQQFYQSFIKADVKALSSAETAEMAKILENTFRLVNISMINELALFSGKMGIDIWEVIEGAKTKPFGFMPFYPSPKVGGHCIGLDPFYLSHKAKEYNFYTRFIELAGEINEQMPHHIITKVIWALNQQGKAVKGSKILVWGAAYKKDVADTRESAVFPIIFDLHRKGAEIDYFDPFVKELEIESKAKEPFVLKSKEYSSNLCKNYDLVLILTDHSDFDYEKIAQNANLVVDTRNAIKSRNHTNVIWL